MPKLMIKNGKVVRLATLPVTNCDNCGACCRHMGTPPGYAAFHQVGGAPIPEWALNSDDYVYWQGVPEEAKKELAEYYRAVQAGEILDRTRMFGKMEPHKDIPCLWYDETTKHCKHYEHRPECCRDPDVMEPGSPACLATRKAFRIPLPVAS
jgi:Fe-S-cluster containining protein